MKLHFEPGLEVDCIREIVSLVSSGEAIQRNVELIDHVTWSIGRLNAFRGESEAPDDETPVFGATGCPENVEDCCTQILAALPEDDAMTGFNPAQVAQLIALLMQLWKLVS